MLMTASWRLCSADSARVSSPQMTTPTCSSAILWTVLHGTPSRRTCGPLGRPGKAAGCVSPAQSSASAATARALSPFVLCKVLSLGVSLRRGRRAHGRPALTKTTSCYSRIQHTTHHIDHSHSQTPDDLYVTGHTAITVRRCPSVDRHGGHDATVRRER